MTKQTVCVQGLGFVGCAMAVATAVSNDQQPQYKVIGVELDTPDGRKKIEHLNNGDFPLSTNDQDLIDATKKVVAAGDLEATSDIEIYEQADVVLVSLPLNISSLTDENRQIVWGPFKTAIEDLAQRIPAECLVIVETTVPPGTCRKVIYPILQKGFAARDIKTSPLLAHAFERVTPGANYLNSIIHYYRCFSAICAESEARCKKFLESIINTDKWPLTKLNTLEASETAKLLENSYRAVTIALMEEWSDFAEDVGIDLFGVIEGIKKRETHSNMRYPGFGVGGYCLTKDPLFALQGARELFDNERAAFPFCELAVKTNKMMPLRCLKRLEEQLKGLSGKNILLLGVSYKQDVGDTRFSPSEDFIRSAIKAGAKVDVHDPLVSHWPEMEMTIQTDLQKFKPSQYDAIVLAVPHGNYSDFELLDWLGDANVLLFDACGFLSENQVVSLKDRKHPTYVIGYGRIT